ncbi:SDR family NAD(P)-dependent oxidoreductase [Pectinatus frisingensis]|uniref:SDR family NAD(P)-dependent oxidoreductase n=1 Tax=Pectinatus frisingensis TaxID=865 RepID=UPI0018C7A433|nr:SDR family NAD(P)-dependent oxidoreductase [Pectinatus frisingensis]
MNIALISGASSGLGCEFVKLLSQEGSLDAIWCIARSQPKLLAMKKSLTMPLQLFFLDLTDKNSIDSIQTALNKEKPNIKCLINAAGIGKIGSYNDISLSDCSTIVDLNCRAAMLLTQAALPFMHPHSHILQICSTAAFQPLPYFNIYAASKVFLYYYSRALQIELTTRHISVTAVCPYWIKDTNFIDTAQKTADNTYIKRFIFASRCQKIAIKALRDAKRDHSVSTPGIICTIHHFIAKFIPFSIMMHGWNIVRKL